MSGGFGSLTIVVVGSYLRADSLRLSKLPVACIPQACYIAHFVFNKLCLVAYLLCTFIPLFISALHDCDLFSKIKKMYS